MVSNDSTQTATVGARLWIASALFPTLLLCLSLISFVHFPAPSHIGVSVAELNTYIDRNGRRTEKGIKAGVPEELTLPVVRLRAGYYENGGVFYNTHVLTLAFTVLYFFFGANVRRTRSIVSLLAIALLLLPIFSGTVA